MRQDLRKRGRVGLRGDRLTLIWRRLFRSVVFPAESNALASARADARS